MMNNLLYIEEWLKLILFEKKEESYPENENDIRIYPFAWFKSLSSKIFCLIII